MYSHKELSQHNRYLTAAIRRLRKHLINNPKDAQANNLFNRLLESKYIFKANGY